MLGLLSKFAPFFAGSAPYLFLSASRKIGPNDTCFFSIYDPSLDEVSNVEIPLHLAHSVVGNARSRRRAIAVEQYGPKMCEVDLVDQRVSRLIEAGKGRAFYGHGTFSADAKLFFSTEISTDEKEDGFLVVRDGATLAELDVLPAYGRRPHDITLVENGTVLFVANQGAAHTEPNGEPTSLAFIDLASGKLVRKMEDSRAGFLFSHLATNKLGHMAAALFHPQPKQDPESIKIRKLLENPETRAEGVKRSIETIEYRSAPLFFVGADLREHAPESAYADMRMTLSLCMHSEKPVLGAIHVMSGLVTFSDASTNALLHAEKIDEVPQGIALTEDGKAFVVSTMSDSLFYFDAGNFRLLKRIRPRGFQFGHHLLAWKTA